MHLQVHEDKNPKYSVLWDTCRCNYELKHFVSNWISLSRYDTRVFPTMGILVHVGLYTVSSTEGNVQYMYKSLGHQINKSDQSGDTANIHMYSVACSNI